MANRKKTGNIVSMKRRRSKTLGVILCLFSLYLLVMFIMSMTKDHLSIYEVNETQIADDETIRAETVCTLRTTSKITSQYERPAYRS